MESLGKYQFERNISAGERTDLILANDTVLERRVVLKVFREDGRSTGLAREEARRTLLRGARIAARLLHPNIVAVFDAANEDGTAYVAMEYFESSSLEEKLRSQVRLDPAEVLALLRQIAAALDHSHENGLIHRDLNPEKILCNPQGIAKLSGFGIARNVSGPETRVGVLPAAPHYMAPEQLKGNATRLSDQYSLAVVAYRSLSGKLPFENPNLIQLMQEIAYDPVPDISLHSPAMPPGAQLVLAKALAKEEGSRYSNCTEFVRELEAALQMQPVATAHSSSRSGGRALWFVLGAAASAAAIFAWLQFAAVP